jgi:hypothetical protein
MPGNYTSLMIICDCTVSCHGSSNKNTISIDLKKSARTQTPAEANLWKRLALRHRKGFWLKRRIQKKTCSASNHAVRKTPFQNSCSVCASFFVIVCTCHSSRGEHLHRSNRCLSKHVQKWDWEKKISDLHVFASWIPACFGGSPLYQQYSAQDRYLDGRVYFFGLYSTSPCRSHTLQRRNSGLPTPDVKLVLRQTFSPTPLSAELSPLLGWHMWRPSSILCTCVNRFAVGVHLSSSLHLALTHAVVGCCSWWCARQQRCGAMSLRCSWWCYGEMVYWKTV